MSKTEYKQYCKDLAKKTILTSLGCAYYKIADDDSISLEEKELICHYIDEYGEKMAKAIKGEYVCY